jgi:hypothetical protein
MTKLSMDSIKKKLAEAEVKSPLPAGNRNKERKVPTNPKGKDGSASSNKPQYTRSKDYTTSGPKGNHTVDKSKDTEGTPTKPTHKTTEYGKGQTAKMTEKPTPKMNGAGSNNNPNKDPKISAGDTVNGKPTFVRKAKNETPPTVGQMDTLKGSILPGLDPKKAKKITFSIRKEGGDPNKEVKLNKVTEGIVDGTVELYVGGAHKGSFAAAHGRKIAKLVEGYIDLGRNVKITFAPRSRACYKNSLFHNTMMEAAHYGYHKVDARRDELLNKAFVQFRESMKRDGMSSLFKTRTDWISKAVRPAFEQVMETYSRAYNNNLKSYEVQVRTESRKGNQDVLILTNAINEAAAAHIAAERILAEDGLTTKVKHLFVDGKKYLPEAAEKGLFDMEPKFFSDMPGPMGMLNAKSQDGKSSENKPEKAKTMEFGGKSAFAKEGDRKIDIKRMDQFGGKGGDASGKVEKNPKAPAAGSVHKVQVRPASNSGPIYEDINVIATMKKYASEASNKTSSAALNRMIEKLSTDEPLTEKESKVLDYFIDKSLTH